MTTEQAYNLGLKDGATRTRKNIAKVMNAKTGKAELLKAYNAGWASNASGADFKYKAGF